MQETTLSREQVRAATQRAGHAIAGQQREDGSWQSRNDAGPLFTGAALAFERALGVLGQTHARSGERFLRHVQLADGSAEAWPFAGRGSLEATSFWLAGMRAVGVGDDDAAVRRASAYVNQNGGLAKNRLIVRALLASVGLIEASTLPRLPILPHLVPGYEGALSSCFGVNALIPLHTLPALLRGLRVGKNERRALGRRARRAVIEYLSARQDPSGSWAGVPYYTLQAALTLHLCGIATSDQRICRAIEFARRVYETRAEGLFVGAFESGHWDSAHLIRALLPLNPEHPAIDRAAHFLVEGQSTQPSPHDWQAPPRGAPPHGGWAWQSGNVRNPDLDSTAEVLSGLGRLMHVRAAPGVRSAVSAGLAWLLSFQNADGGWAAFSHGKLAAPSGPLFLPKRATSFPARVANSPAALRRFVAEIGDPSTADVTGRVLYALGTLGLNRAHPRVRAAIRFLERHQMPETGAWWSRWAVNYLPGTAYVLTGLFAVGEPVASPLIQRGLTFLLSRQNEDGGWGELPDSYADPERAGVGPSSVQVTGIVLWALLSLGVRNDATSRGVRFLLERQLPDGSFHDRACFGTIFPHLHYYYSESFPTYFAVEALHAWLG